MKSCQEAWPDSVDPPPSDTAMAELTKTSVQDTHVLASITSSIVVNLANVVNCQRISSFRTLLRVTAHVLKFLE